ncbi:MAG: hypothetical protein JWP44_4909 [Mucilaginibacter sp.]|nr:hypothetical protein [Mucilaginibacter sp.]
MGIPSVIWKPGETYLSAWLVFTTPETFFTPLFTQLLHSLLYSRRLDRIFVDECYTILEGSDAFWPKLRELGKLRQLGV